MEKTFDFGYGDGQVSLTIRARQIGVLQAETPPPIRDLRAAFRAAVEEQAIASKPLRELVSADDYVTVIISDLTRAWMHQDRICPLLLDYLHDVAGVPDANIVFLVALGTHRPQTEAELRRIAGEGVLSRVRVVNHEAGKPLVRVGVTRRGTVVEVNPLAVHRKVIVIGGTVHHLLAGYGGGRKSIVPGVAGERTIRQNHRHALHPTQPRSSDAVGCGRLAGNPVHEDMMEAAAMVAPVFGINLVVDAQGDAIALPSGDWALAWAESCRLVDRYNGVAIPAKADAVVVSCGGFPKDMNLYQGSKTLINAYQAVREGGRLMLIAQCPEGGGPAEFFGWSRYLPAGRLDAALREDFTIAGYVFYACCEIAAHTELHMLSQLPGATVAPMGVHACADVAEMQRMMDFGDQTVYVMPNGGGTVPMVERPENEG